MELDERDLLNELEKKEELKPEPPGRLQRIGVEIKDHKYLIAAVVLELIFFLLIKVKSHRWLMAIVLTVLWFTGLCVAATELFSEFMIRKWLAFFVLASYLYVFYRLFLFIVSTFA